jgi:hypothetical protein
VKQQNDQEAAVEEGLNTGEIVVTSGFGRLREGEHVIVERPDAPGPVDQGKGGKGKGKGKRVSKSSD